MKRYGVIALLALLARASAICGAVHEPVISSVLGKRSIAAGSDAALAQAPNDDECSYAYLVLERIPTPRMRAELAAAGVSIRELHSVQGSYYVYLAHCGEGMNISRQALREKKWFHSLAPVLAEDRMTVAIARKEGYGQVAVDTVRGTVAAGVLFQRGLSPSFCDSILGECCAHVNPAKPGRYYIVEASPDCLFDLAHVHAVRSVFEARDTIEMVNDHGRELAGIELVQNLDTVNTPFPPRTAQYWVPSSDYTGEGVIVGIYDRPVDSFVVDLCETTYVSGQVDTVARRAAGLPWDPPSPYLVDPENTHGCHVAATVGGNGWQSRSAGGAQYQWRGVAPRVKFTVEGPTYNTQTGLSRGDVNNHSHTCSPGYYRSSYVGQPAHDFLVDDAVLPNGDSTSNIIVYAAGNAAEAPYGGQRGFYSLCVSAKNCITVGAVYSQQTHQGYALRCDFSSLGPTRDGRIKPDVMAPGANRLSPLGSPADPIKIVIDSVAFLDSAGTTKVGWGFSSGTMGWGTIHQPTYISNVTEDSGYLVLTDTSYGATIWSDSLSRAGLYPMTYGRDSLYMRYRFELPQGYDPGMLHCGMVWRIMVTPPVPEGYHRGSVAFDLQTAPGFHELRLKLQQAGPLYNSDSTWALVHNAATKRDTLVAIRFDFGLDTTVGVRSAQMDTLGGGYVRDGMSGTSMAAPFVSGTIALMLDKYNRVYLQPQGKSLRTDAFWNSTARAILIHTATDLKKITAYGGEHANFDTKTFVCYDDGPDYATGWGLVNAHSAMCYVDTTRFKQDSIDHDEVSVYKARDTSDYYIDIPLRFTLAWDDPAVTGATDTNCYEIKLINDLDLHVLSPDGYKWLPWVLDTLPHADTLPSDGYDSISMCDLKEATRGVDVRNNVEVVDAWGDTGIYTIVVKGSSVPANTPLQGFSIVSLDSMWKDESSTWLINKVNHATTGEQIVASADDYDIVHDADIGAVSGVTLTFSQGATITVAPDCCIDVGSTGTIVGAQNALQGEYYTVDLYSIGSLNKIGGRAEFVGASSAPCGTVYSSKNIVLAEANMIGCSRDYTAEDDIVIEDGNTIGNGTILTVN